MAIGDNTPAAILRRLAENRWRGQIVGRHGAGKSTLLAALAPLVLERGRRWQRINLHSERSRDDWASLQRVELSSQTVLVVDGFEQLGRLARQWIGWRTTRTRAGLLCTTHEPLGLPTIATLAPDLSHATALFRRLIKHTASPVTETDLRDAFNACNGNIRDTWFYLYDLHERHVRGGHVANRKHATPVTISGGEWSEGV